MNGVQKLQQTKEQLDSLIKAKRFERESNQNDLLVAQLSILTEQNDLIIALLSKLPEDIGNKLDFNQTLKDTNQAIVKEIRAIKIPTPEVSVNVPNVVVPEIIIPPLPKIELPKRDMEETNKLLTKLLSKETPKVDLKETNDLLKKVAKEINKEVEIDFNIT